MLREHERVEPDDPVPISEGPSGKLRRRADQVKCDLHVHTSTASARDSAADRSLATT